MALRPSPRSRSFALDGEWTLEDLSVFSATYTQVYSVLYMLDDRLLIPGAGSTPTEYSGVRDIFQAFPWRGGYSAVNFYHTLSARVQRSHRPIVLSIRYSSPGILELGLIVSVAASVAAIVKSLASCAKDANSTYTEIYKGMRDRQLMDIDLKRKEIDLEREQLEFARDSAKELAEIMDFRKLDSLRELSGHDLLALKILLSLFRRFKKLKSMEDEGRIEF